MKKILEVLQYGECDFRFSTDLKQPFSQEKALALVSGMMFAFSSKVFGSFEQNLTAAIRLVALAELSLCGNVDECIAEMRKEANSLNGVFREAVQMMQKEGKAILLPSFIKTAKKGS